MRYAKAVVVAALLAMLVGCVEFLSWSPDGRLLLFLDGQGAAWLWDTTTGQAGQVSNAKSVVAGMLLDNEGSMLLLRNLPEQDDTKRGPFDLGLGTLVKGDSKSGSWEEVLPKTGAHAYGLSSDRSTLYYTDAVGDPPRYELRALNLKQPGEPRLILESPKDIAFPQPTPSGDNLLFVRDDDEFSSVCLLPLETAHAEPKILFKARTYWPRWVDDDRFVGIKEDPEKGEQQLFVYNRQDGQFRVLYAGAIPHSAPSLAQARQAVYAAGIRKDVIDHSSDLNGDWPAATQIMRADLSTGEIRQVTDDPLGAMHPSVDPAGKRLAYVNAIDGPPIVHVLNLETGEDTIVWRNEEERLYAEAQRLERLGDRLKAVLTYRDLLGRFPETDLDDAAWYHVMLILLGSDGPDLDGAVEAMGHLDTKLRDQALALFWQGIEPVATDPADDLIRRYGTEAAAAEFKFDTDKTRDLLALRARWSERHLYLRIDFAVPHDLQGLAFMDLVLLFNHDSSTGSFHRVTPCADWDLPIERQIWIRHWTAGGENVPFQMPGSGLMAGGSQYDAEILDGAGNAIARFLASGFVPAIFPPCQVLAPMARPDGSGSIVLAIDRDMLQLPAGNSTRIQVCTVKGGVEEQRGLERPRETPESGQPSFDVADAFGPENTAERVDADLAAGKPTPIRGAAATLTP